MAATTIEVTPAGNQLYEVEVRDEQGASTHQVSLPEELLERLDTEDASPGDLVHAAIGFLSTREGGHQELDDKIDLSAAAGHYEGFVERVSDLARQRVLHGHDQSGDTSDGEPTGDDRLLAEVREEQDAGEVSRPPDKL